MMHQYPGALLNPLLSQDRVMLKADFKSMLVFVAVIELQGLALAGQALGISQGTVSLHLSRFRLQFDKPLFTRTGRALEPTPEAYDLARQLRAVLSELYSVMFSPVMPGWRLQKDEPADMSSDCE